MGLSTGWFFDPAGGYADLAQLVELLLPKQTVVGSNPIIRSKSPFGTARFREKEAAPGGAFLFRVQMDPTKASHPAGTGLT